MQFIEKHYKLIIIIKSYSKSYKTLEGFMIMVLYFPGKSSKQLSVECRWIAHDWNSLNLNSACVSFQFNTRSLSFKTAFYLSTESKQIAPISLFHILDKTMPFIDFGKWFDGSTESMTLNVSEVAYYFSGQGGNLKIEQTILP